MVFAVVTGGGTSGHVIPAQAILEALLEAGYPTDELRYVGSTRGVERSLMKPFPIEAVYLPVSGLQRTINVRNLGRNFVFPLRLLQSRIAARRHLREWSPSVVVSVGGYASEPMSRAAIAAGVPLVCVSYDRIPGLATRRQAKHATVNAVAFADSLLPRAVHTGAPVRSELRHLNVGDRREQIRSEWGIEKHTVLVTVVGGSLGSATLNAFVASLLDAGGTLSGTQLGIFHICGERNAKEPLPYIPENVWYRRVGYENRMADVYSALDLLITRAGASSIAEIATVGIASVIVPWPASADQHQELNARWLSDSTAAVMISDEQCVSGSALQIVLDLVENQTTRRALAMRARELGQMHRGDSLVTVIRNAAR